MLPSAVYAIRSLLRAPLSGVVVAAANQAADFLDQLLPFVFGLAPVWLVVHLARRSGEGMGSFGFDDRRVRGDVVAGLGLFAVVGIGGAAVYLVAVELGVNRFVLPAPPDGYWWTWLAVVMNAAGAALLEETVVLAYLVTRLQQFGWSAWAAIGASAALRALVPPVPGVGRVPREPRDGAALRPVVRAVAPRVAVRDRAPAVGRGRRRRVPVVRRPPARVLNGPPGRAGTPG